MKHKVKAYFILWAEKGGDADEFMERCTGAAAMAAGQKAGAWNSYGDESGLLPSRLYISFQ